MGSRVRRSRAEKQAAVDLAREVGVAEAARRLRVPAGSISKWRHHGVGGDTSGPEAPRRRGAQVDELGRLEQSLLATQDAYDQLVADGDHVKARACAVSLGILTDKLLLVRRGRLGGGGAGGSDAREKAIRSIAELRDQIVAERRERLNVRLSRGTLTPGDIATYWLGFVGCDRGEPSPGGWRRRAPEVYQAPYRSEPVRPVPVVVRPVPADELEDDEPVEAELLEDVVVPMPPRPRALPRAGSSQFAAGSIQRLLAGWGGSDG